MIPKQILRNVFIGGSFLGMGYLSGLGVLEAILIYSGEPIQNQEKLEQVLQEEREHLCVHNEDITARFGDSEYYSHSTKLSENTYEIVLDDGRSRAFLRHELYHVCDGHFEASEQVSSGYLRGLTFFIIYEPQADLYQNLGVKL